MKFLNSKKGTIILTSVAVALLVVSGIGSTQAALTYFSENYTAQVEMKDIGVTLVETSAQSTKDISSRDYTGSDDAWDTTQGALLTDMLEESDNQLQLGRAYKEELSVKNTGTINEYVRVRIYKSWTDEDGNKETTLSPSLIILHMTNNGWIIDEDASTEERTVLYWPNILAVGETTSALSDTLTIDSSIGNKVTKTTTVEDGVTKTTTKFNYDGVKFNLKAEVDAVQTHNAKDAIKSAWGVDVNVADDGSIRLQ
jgi:hypothetical protein